MSIALTVAKPSQVLAYANRYMAPQYLSMTIRTLSDNEKTLLIAHENYLTTHHETDRYERILALTYGHATLQKDGLSLLKDAFDPIIDSYSHYIARNNFHTVFQNSFTQMFLYHHPNFVSKPEDFNDLLHPRRGDVGDSITLDYSDLNIFFMHYIKNMDTFLKVCALGGGFSEYLRLRLFNAEKIVSLNNPEVLWTSSHYDLSIKMISDYIIAGNLLSFFVKTPLDLMRFFEKIEFSERHDNSWKHQIKLSDLNEAWITKNSAAFDNLKGSSRSNANFFFKTLICAVHAAQHIYPLH